MAIQVPGPVSAIADVVCLDHMLSRGQWQPVEVSFIQRNIRVLSEAAQAGVAKVPQDIQDSLRLIDPMLRARWDFVVDMWAVERWVEEEDYCRWEFIAHRRELGPKLFHDLKKGDTWKDGKDPRERLQEKREGAEKVKADNEHRSNEKIAAAVDTLSDKQVREFLAVEEALASGDKITCHGSDNASMEILTRVSKGAPAIPQGQSINRQMKKPRFKLMDGKEKK